MKQPLGRPFWRFWTAAALANLGDGIRLAAFPLLAVSVSDSPLGVGVVVAAQSLPWLVTGLLAGALADRRATRILVAGADLGRMLVLALLIVAVATDVAGIAIVALSAFLLGVGETVRDTAAQTAVPRLVPPSQLERANGRLVAGEVMGNEFVGPPVGSALFAAGAVLPFTVNGASMALAAMLVLSLPLSLLDAPKLVGQAVAGGGIRGGIGWLARHRVLRAMVVVGAAVAAADSAWFAVLVLFAQDTLAVGTAGFGALLATGAAGGLIGAFAAERLISERRHRGVLAWSLAVTAGTPVLLVIAPDLWAAVIVLLATSASFAVLNVTALSLRQRLVPEGLLGRVTATSRTVVYGAAALGAVLGGALASVGGLQTPFLFSGVIAVLATATWWIASRPAPGGELPQAA